MRLTYRRQSIKWISLIGFLLLLSASLKAANFSTEQQADEVIFKLYQELNLLPPKTMANRIDIISAQFIGKLYLLGALGEGENARFDQEPRYRVDAFDCDTYVTTVLALTLASNQEGFRQCLNKIRYKEGKVDFITRNHFMSLDWNPNNQEQHFIKDITTTIKDKNNQPIAQMATALIDKPSWYQHFTTKNIRLNSENKNEQAQRLTVLKTEGSKLAKQNATIPYLPLTSLFDAAGLPNQFIFNQIPHGAIIEIVRPNWNLQKEIGTRLNVSHLGFAFWKDKTLFYRQASSKFGKVVEVPLIDYLRETLKSPTIKGINIEMMVPESPLNEQCLN